MSVTGSLIVWSICAVVFGSKEVEGDPQQCRSTCLVSLLVSSFTLVV